MMAPELAGTGLHPFLTGEIKSRWRRHFKLLVLSFAVLGLALALCASSLWYGGLRADLERQSSFHARMYMEQFHNNVKKYVQMTGMLEAMLRDQSGVIQNFTQLAKFI
ncbi:MAG: hypothetical protein ACI4NA_03615, partial [Succinivibrio sp.]